MALVEVMSVQPGSESRMALQLASSAAEAARRGDEGRRDERWSEFHAGRLLQ